MVVSTWEEYWASGVGAMLWTTLDGDKALAVLVPDPEHGKPHNVILHVNRQPQNWADKGPVAGWDGNETEPTLTPSIDVPGVWHGFVVLGRLALNQRGSRLVRPQHGQP